MTGTIEKAVEEIRLGRRYPVYLLHGEEFLAKEGAKAIVEALVPPAQHSLSLEVIPEDRDLASLPVRLHTPSLFGGAKVVMVHDSKAFLSSVTLERLVATSREAWKEGEPDRSLRLFLQAVAAAGESEGFLDRAARGEIAGGEVQRLFSVEADSEAEQWLREMAGRAVAEGMAIPEISGAGLARVYEETLQRGIPPGASLVLTAVAVDERRALFKKICAVGFVIDCGARPRKPWDTQMDPDAARRRIRETMAAAGKTIGGEAVTCIVERTGLSMRSLDSEVEKVLLYVGTRPTVTTTDVLEILSSSREANIFDLTNAVGGRDAGKALQALRSLMIRREPVPRILGTLAGEVRNLIVARAVLDQALGGRLDPGLPYDAFRSRVLPRLAHMSEGDDGSAARLLEMNPFRVFNLLKAATRFSLQDLVRGLETIHDTDLALKTSGHPEGMLMERLVIGLCAAGEPENPARGIPRASDIFP